MTTQRRLALVTAALSTGLLASGAARAGDPSTSTPDADGSDSEHVLPAGQDGTDLGSFTVEGEDRIRIEFERPSLDLTIDPRSVGGLDWSDPNEILERKRFDTTTPFLRAETRWLPTTPARPWARSLVYGDIVTLRPKVDDVATWRLTISDPTGAEVWRVGGEGKAPREITWDGMTMSGRAALPGQTYVHAIDVVDKAGNKRRFNGSGFVMPAFAVTAGDSLRLAVAGEPDGSGRLGALAIVEIADWINQHAAPSSEIRLSALARTYGEAESMSGAAQGALVGLVAGDPIRMRTIARVDPAAPQNGVLTVQFHVGSTPPEPPDGKR